MFSFYFATLNFLPWVFKKRKKSPALGTDLFTCKYWCNTIQRPGKKKKRNMPMREGNHIYIE